MKSHDLEKHQKTLARHIQSDTIKGINWLHQELPEIDTAPETPAWQCLSLYLALLLSNKITWPRENTENQKTAFQIYPVRYHKTNQLITLRIARNRHTRDLRDCTQDNTRNRHCTCDWLHPRQISAIRMGVTIYSNWTIRSTTKKGKQTKRDTSYLADSNWDSNWTLTRTLNPRTVTEP